MQDATRAERLLRRLRESALCEGRDIADTSELMGLAGEVGLDLDRFATALESGAAGNAFNEDLLIAAELGGSFAVVFLQFVHSRVRLR